MTTPATRDEVVEIIARHHEHFEGRHDAPEDAWRDWVFAANQLIADLEAAGLRIVPAEATEGMIEAMAQRSSLTEQQLRGWSGLSELTYPAAIAASPYNQQEGG